MITGQTIFHYTYAPDFIHILGVNTGIGFELVQLLAETLAHEMKPLEKKKGAYETF